MINARRLVLSVGLLAVLATFLPYCWLEKASARLPSSRYTDPSALGSGISLPTDNVIQNGMEKCRELVEEKNWEEAIDTLQVLLNKDEDVFVRVKHSVPGQAESALWVSVRTEANRLLGSMDKEGLGLYEQQLGQTAVQDLAVAKEKGDLVKMAKVAQKYMHTKAGTEAAVLLATHALHRNDPRQAALRFRQLVERKGLVHLDEQALFHCAVSLHLAGDKPLFNDVWTEITARTKNAGGLKFGKEVVSLDKVREEMNKLVLAQPMNLPGWKNFRGGPTRTEQAFGGAPSMEYEWFSSTMESADQKDDDSQKANFDSYVGPMVKNAAANQERIKQPLLNSFFPVSGNGRLIFRGYDGIFAVSLKTGMCIWTSMADGGVGQLTSTNKKPTVEQWKYNYTRTGPMGILFENSVIGSLSTDGGRVFMVDDIILPPHPSVMRPGVKPSFTPEINPLVYGNSLKAFAVGPATNEKEGGKVLWQLGDGADPKGPFYESFFMGAPLPLGGKLYVLNEKDNVLRLVCLEPRDDPDKADDNLAPIISWIQPLATTRDHWSYDLTRRTTAAHLAYGDGILICPTNAGGILGVDLLSHSLVWAYSYRPGGFDGEGKGAGKSGTVAQGQEWRTSAPAIVDGKVVFTAPDDGDIHCLNLADGRLLWKQPRKPDDCYFAGVFNGSPLIVGKDSVRALNLADGKMAWNTMTGLISGQGAASDNIYYLPVAHGLKDRPEICSIDLANKGAILTRLSIPGREGNDPPEPPGNLVFCDGHVVCQSATQVIVFPQLKARMLVIEEKLKANPRDPFALADRGELRLGKGDYQGACGDLRAALANGEDKAELVTRVKLKLYDALTGYLQKDFGTAEKYLEEYQKLCKTDDAAESNRRQANYLYLLANGRERQGRLVEALKAYIQFGDFNQSDKMVKVVDDPNAMAQPTVWARGRIATMLAKASPDQKKELEAKIASEFEPIKDSSDLKALRRFANVFAPAFPAGNQARLRLAECLLAGDSVAADQYVANLREAEGELLKLRNDQDRQMAGRGVEALARVMMRKGSMETAFFYYRELGREFPKVMIRDGKTGADIFNELATDKRFWPYLVESSQTWKGDLKGASRQTPGRSLPLYTLEATGELTPFYQGHRFVFDPSPRNQLRIIDKSTGSEHFAIAAPYIATRTMQSEPRPSYRVVGNTAVVTLGHMVYGLDAAGKKQLWEYNLFAPGKSSNTAPLDGQIQRDSDGVLQLVDGLYKQRLGSMGPSGPGYVCLQTKTGLVALDPQTGIILWTRADVTGRCQVFGDDEYVYLADPSDGKPGFVLAVRARDGLAVPAPNMGNALGYRIAALKGNLLVRETVAAGKVELRLYSIMAGKDLWKKTFASGSVVLQSDDPGFAGVIEPDGKLTIVDLKAHKEVLQASLKYESGPAVNDMLERVQLAHLLVDDDSFSIALRKPNTIPSGPYAAVTGIRTVDVNGHVFVFDRRSGELGWADHVPHQYLIVDQFKDMPVMIFAARTTEQILPAPGQPGQFRRTSPTQQVITVRSIQKSSGKHIFPNPNAGEDKLIQPAGFFSLEMNTRAATIDLVGQTLTVHFGPDLDSSLEGANASKTSTLGDTASPRSSDTYLRRKIDR